MVDRDRHDLGRNITLKTNSSPRRPRRLAAAIGAMALTMAGALPLLLMAAPANAQTVRYVDDDVGCDGQRPCYQTIQGAVDAADSGDILSLAAGYYTETVLVVDKSLAFEGPGAGEAPGAPDPEQVAAWSAADPSDAALIVDARTGDVSGTRVTGLRVASAAVGVALIGRRAGDPVPVPLGLPPSAVDTSVTGTLIADTVFVSTTTGVRAQWADGLSVERIRSPAAGSPLPAGPSRSWPTASSRRRPARESSCSCTAILTGSRATLSAHPAVAASRCARCSART